jgi:hypothetical protein
MRSKTRLFAALFSVAVFGLVVDIDLTSGSGPQEVSAAVADELVGGTCQRYVQSNCGYTTGPNKATCPVSQCWKAWTTGSVDNQIATGGPVWCGGSQSCLGVAYSSITPCNSGSSGGGGGSSSGS